MLGKLVVGSLVGLFGVAACTVTTGGNTDVDDNDDLGTPTETPSPDAATPDPTPTTPDSCYEGTTLEDTVELQWADNNARGEITLTAPDEPGGGYYVVTVDAAHPDVDTWVEVTTGDGSGSLINGSAKTPAERNPIRKIAFAAAPNQVYTVKAWQFFKAPAEAHPIDYKISWTYTSVVDCYEANDTAAAAKPIAFGETISAYAFAGHRDNYTRYNTFADWYSFEVTEESKVQADLLQPPGDQARIRIGLYDETGTRQLASELNDAGQPVSALSNRVLAPGKYTMSVTVHTTTSFIDDNVPTLPAAFTTPYQVRVSAAE